jgi:hypothetical protein
MPCTAFRNQKEDKWLFSSGSDYIYNSLNWNNFRKKHLVIYFEVSCSFESHQIKAVPDYFSTVAINILSGKNIQLENKQTNELYIILFIYLLILPKANGTFGH